MKFVHLHTHSHYSLLDGLSKTDDLVNRAAELEMPALAITDHGGLYGAIEFYKSATAKGIKPIIGVEAYIASRSRFDKQPHIDNKRYHLTLLAKNLTGYKNLLKLVTAANMEGYYYKPRMDKELLKKYSDGLICLSGCYGGELSRALRNKNQKQAEAVIQEHQDIFGKENYFIEIMHHPNIEGMKTTKEKTIELAKKFNIPLVATQDSHYIHSGDAKAQDTMLAIQTNSDFGDESRLTMLQDDFSFINQETALKYFKDTPEAIANTLEIANMCDIKLELGKWVFPNFQIPSGTTYDSELRRIVYEGITNRYRQKTKEIENRIEYELKIISDKGFSPYFLVVADLMRFARENKILTNVRGSVAGSITTYLSNITNIDPLKFKLPFERFLNPERPSPPDMDMDFADNHRDKVIEYTRKKYGDDKVAQIGTFGTMMAKAAVRDVARALGKPYATGNRIASLIPLGSQGFPMSIDRALELTPDLKKIYENEEEVKEIIDLAKKMEGCVRHVSVHAAGVVIAPEKIEEFAPLQFDPKGGKIITQFDMYSIEETGLLKFDFLGIRNLSILENSIRLVKTIQNKEIDIENIPLDDKKTFELLSSGETIGLFQLNGSGMTRYLKELKPTTIHDINLMVALYRPGPMENINEYIARKHGKKPTTYLHPKMKNFLEETYGVLVYQDDLLMTAVEVAGYSWGEVDKFRKAVGKKIPEEMAKQRKIFIAGCQKNGGLTEKKAEELWKLFEPFQGYGFNKAHAASYGQVAYQTAYMKANFPIEYMTAILTAESGDNEKISEIISECKRMKIAVLPPDINESFTNFTVINPKTIRFGLLTVKNVGENIVNAIIEARKNKGKFISITDFLEKVQHKDLNKKSMESLIKCGALDAFGERNQLLINVEKFLNFSREAAKSAGQNQVSLFDNSHHKTPPTIKLDSTAPVSKTQKLSWEKELLGLYISDHPLNGSVGKKINSCSKVTDLTVKPKGLIKIGGLISKIKKVVTKTGLPMIFATVEDLTGKIEAIVFPKVLQKNPAIWEEEKIVLIKGRMSSQKEALKFICEEAEEIFIYN